MPSPKGEQTHKRRHTWAARQNTLPEGPQEAAKWVFTWTQEDEASDLQKFFWVRAASFGERASGFASGPVQLQEDARRICHRGVSEVKLVEVGGAA